MNSFLYCHLFMKYIFSIICFPFLHSNSQKNMIMQNDQLELTGDIRLVSPDSLYLRPIFKCFAPPFTHVYIHLFHKNLTLISRVGLCNMTFLF